MHNELKKECPICKMPLTIISDNYSGCGIDIGKCEECDRIFQISYKVDEIIETK